MLRGIEKQSLPKANGASSEVRFPPANENVHLTHSPTLVGELFKRSKRTLHHLITGNGHNHLEPIEKAEPVPEKPVLPRRIGHLSKAGDSPEAQLNNEQLATNGTFPLPSTADIRWECSVEKSLNNGQMNSPVVWDEREDGLYRVEYWVPCENRSKNLMTRVSGKKVECIVEIRNGGKEIVYYPAKKEVQSQMSRTFEALIRTENLLSSLPSGIQLDPMPKDRLQATKSELKEQRELLIKNLKHLSDGSTPEHVEIVHTKEENFTYSQALGKEGNDANRASIDNEIAKRHTLEVARLYLQEMDIHGSLIVTDGNGENNTTVELPMEIWRTIADLAEADRTSGEPRYPEALVAARRETEEAIKKYAIQRWPGDHEDEDALKIAECVAQCFGSFGELQALYNKLGSFDREIFIKCLTEDEKRTLGFGIQQNVLLGRLKQVPY